MRRPMFAGIPVRTSVSVMALNVGFLGGFFMPVWLVNDLLVCVTLLVVYFAAVFSLGRAVERSQAINAMRDHEHAGVVRRGGTTKTMNAAALVTAQKAAAAPLLAALVYVGVDGTYPQHQHFVAVFMAVTGFAVAWAVYTACMDSREPWAVVARAMPR